MSLARELRDCAREEVGRIVESGVDLVAGGKAGLRGGEKICSRLEREQVLTNRRGENDIRHRTHTFLV